MKKNIVVYLVIVLIGFSSDYYLNNVIVGNSIAVSNNFNEFILERPNDKENMDRFWTEENKSFLSEQQQEILETLQKKVIDGNNLSIEEREVLSNLRGDVLVKKLGQTRFDRYKKLIEKREKQERGQLEIEMSKEEKTEIYNFEKEIKGKR